MTPKEKPKAPPRVLTIAGSDSSCGSGVQADLRVMSRAGVVPCSVVTSVTAQSRETFLGAHGVPAEMIEAQLKAVMKDGAPAATKIGMLGTKAAIEVVCRAIDRWKLKNVVLDPVLRSTSEGTLLDAGAIDYLKEELLPRVCVITPNLEEAEALVGYPVRSEEAMRSAAATLADQTKELAVLIKGGHLKSEQLGDGEEIFDIFRNADSTTKLTGGALGGGDAGDGNSVEARGTGCMLASSIAIHLARGDDLAEAVPKARGFVRLLVEAAGKGQVPWMLGTSDGFYIEALLDG